MAAYGVISFVNLGRQDAFLSVSDAEGAMVFIGKLASGQTTRQYTPVGAVWSIVTGGSSQVTAEAGEHVCLINERGVELVGETRVLQSQGGTADVDFPAHIGGG